MAELTRKEMIEQLKAAISAVAVGGQSYKIGSRSLTRANLTELRNTLADLEAQEAAESNGMLLANTSVAFFDTR